MINLRERRIAARMTQTKLAELSGVSQEAISVIERGGHTPSVKTAQKLAKILGVKWTKFFEDTR